jgi:DNA-directed RNA polymerase specialized sigma subunit
MWKYYNSIARCYSKLSLLEERQLISKAQKGSKKSREELVLRHVGFVIFRIHKVAFPALIKRFGEDLLEEAILIIYKKIESYDLNYRDEKGKPNPVKFTSYIWKRIDGFIIDSLRRELNESNYYDRYSGYTLKNGDFSSMCGAIEVDNSVSLFGK